MLTVAFPESTGINEVYEDGTFVGCFMNGDRSADALALTRTAICATMDSIVLRSKQASAEGKAVMAVTQGRDLTPYAPQDTIAYYPDFKDCLDAVNSGEADYTQMPNSFVQKMYTEGYYANVIISSELKQANTLTLALPDPLDITLYSILNKAINSLTAAERDDLLLQSFLPSQTGTATLKALFYTNPVLVVSICVGIVVLAAAVLLLISRSRMGRLGPAPRPSPWQGSASSWRRTTTSTRRSRSSY